MKSKGIFTEDNFKVNWPDYKLIDIITFNCKTLV